MGRKKPSNGNWWLCSNAEEDVMMIRALVLRCEQPSLPWEKTTKDDVIERCEITASYIEFGASTFPEKVVCCFERRALPYVDLVNVLLNASRACGSTIKSCLTLSIFNSHERCGGRAVHKVTCCRPWRATVLICNVPVDKGVPCGSVSCAHSPAECQSIA